VTAATKKKEDKNQAANKKKATNVAKYKEIVYEKIKNKNNNNSTKNLLRLFSLFSHADFCGIGIPAFWGSDLDRR